MADLLKRGADWLESQRKSYLSRTVTYVRGDDTVDWTVTIGRTTFEQADNFGIIHRIETRDYLGAAADLILDGVVTLPQDGDMIRDTIGDSVFVYEVSAPGHEQPWRYSDPYHNTIRVHTKHIATE